jgi:hypothetical protein
LRLRHAQSGAHYWNMKLNSAPVPMAAGYQKVGFPVGWLPLIANVVFPHQSEQIGS